MRSIKRWDWGLLQSVLSNEILGVNAKKCLYDVVIVQTVLYGAEILGACEKCCEKDSQCS